MIIKIPNQPIVFSNPDSETGACGNNQTYCQLVRLNDKVSFQLRQKSCYPDLICNGDFSELGDNLINNGDFYYSESGSGGWQFDPAYWEWDEYGRRLCKIDLSTPLIYEFGSYPNCLFQFSLSVTGLTIGNLVVYVNNSILAEQREIFSTAEDGDYTISYQAIAGDDQFIFLSDQLDMCLDNVSLRCVASCWTITAGAADDEDLQTDILTFQGNGFCKADGQIIRFTEETPSLEAGKYYQTIIRVTGLTQGSLEIFLGTESIGTVTANGVYSLSGISDDDTFSFVMDSDFNGCVMSVENYLLSQDYTLKLKRASDDAVIATLTSSLTYVQEWIEGNILFDEAMLGTIDGYFTDNKVCVYLEIESPDDGEVITNGSFTVTNSQSFTDEWTVDNTVSYNAIQDQFQFKSGNGYLYQDISLGGFNPGDTYYVSFDVLCLDHDTPDYDSFTGYIGAAGDNTGGVPIWDSTNFPDQVGHYAYKVVGGLDGGNLSFHFDDSTGLNKLCLDNISVRTTPCPKELYQSNCLIYGNEFNGTPAWEESKVFTACNEEDESMGFNWSTGFKLQSRLMAHIVSPRYLAKQDETYVRSDGTIKRVYSDSNKKMDLLIEAVDEFTHDYIRVMLKCDVLFIDTDYSLTNRWMCRDGEYSPEWDKKGLNSLAEARTEIERYDNIIFNTNCG